MFCKNCGNIMGEDDRFCAVCGEKVKTADVSGEISKPDEIVEADESHKLSETDKNGEPEESYDLIEDETEAGTEDVHTPLFDFKWSAQGFPSGKAKETEDIDFSWDAPEESPIVKKMREAVDPGEIANTPTFSEEEGKEPVTDEWYEPFSMKRSPDDETLFKFNKRNEEFQELLDKEFERYSTSKSTTLPADATKKYYVADFESELRRFREDGKEETGVSEAPEDSHSQEEPAEPCAKSQEESREKPREEPEEPREESCKEPSYVAGANIIDTSFASPMGLRQEVPSQEVPPQKEEPPQEAQSQKEEPLQEEVPETSTYGFIDTSFASLFGKGNKAVVADYSEDNKTVAAGDKEDAEITAADSGKEAKAIVSSGESVTGRHDSGSEDIKNIEEDEFLKELPSGGTKGFTGPQQIAVQGAPSLVSPAQNAAHRIIGPEIVNEPVVFPFELTDVDESRPGTKSEVESKPKKEIESKPKSEVASKPSSKARPVREDVTSAASRVIPAPVSKPLVSKPLVKETKKLSAKKSESGRSGHGEGLIKFLIAMIVLVLLLLSAVLVMKMAPNSTVGSFLNNVAEPVLSGLDSKPAEKSKVIPPSEDYNALIASQVALNKNIKEIEYSDEIRYDEAVSYNILGANNSKPIENNFWKTVDDKDILFDEQAIRTVISFNSAWADYVSNGDSGVFNFVVPQSEAESALNGEEKSEVIYDKLLIGQVRQNGNKFYVWTQESITIKMSGKKDKHSVINQLYELETTSDSLSITAFVLV